MISYAVFIALKSIRLLDLRHLYARHLCFLRIGHYLQWTWKQEVRQIPFSALLSCDIRYLSPGLSFLNSKTDVPKNKWGEKAARALGHPNYKSNTLRRMTCAQVSI